MPTAKTTDDMPFVGENVSTLQYIEARIHDLREHAGLELQGLREMQLRFREDTDRKFSDHDVRYQQRFDASQQALSAAMVASEKAINSAMVASEKAINAALMSAAQAVQKAETASENRFSSVNEFRAQLADQTATFIPRIEAETRFVSISEKLDALSSRIDKSEGSGQGLSKGWGILLGAVGLLGTLAGIVMLLLSRAQ